MLDTQHMTNLIRRLSWFALFAVVLIGASVGALYVLESRALEDTAEAREVARAARTTASLATDRETSIRGYLLTQDPKSLFRNEIGKAQLRGSLDSMATLVANDKALAQRVRAASDALAKWDQEFATPAAEGRLSAASSVLAGKPLFDVVRTHFGTLIADSDAKFASVSARARQIEFVGAAALLAELVLFFGVLLYLIRGRLIGQANDLWRQQELLEQQAVELELQMDETAQVNQSLSASLAESQLKDENLRRSEERYRFVAKATNDVVYEWDIATNAFEWSEAMLDLFGYAAEDVEDSPNWITGLVHPEDAQRITDTFAAAFTTGAHRWQQPYRLRRKDGKYASVEGRAYILRDAQGEPTKVIGAITDRSSQQSLEEQLRQSQKMDAVGRLAGGVAHDFNNILTVIRMSSEFLLEDLPESNESRHEATEILRAADRAAALTRQLLAFSRHQVLNPRIIALNEVVEGIQGMVKRVVPENIAVNTELQPRLGNIKADTGQIEQVILNLVINAADAMPGGGRLDIRTSNVEVDEAFSASHFVEPGSYVCLTVSDTGNGMDQATVTKIFEPFFTTKAVGKGTGLGLATVHGIVTQTGGKIWVYSEPGVGTTFKVYLPRTEGVARILTPRSLKKMRPATEMVLLVEDEAATRETVQRSLTRAGYKVLLASNGLEALDVAASHPSGIDLVLTDSMMPEMGGLEMVARLRETRPDICVLMMSGYTEQTSGSRFGLSEHPFIEKPFAAADLLAAVQRVLHGEKESPAA